MHTDNDRRGYLNGAAAFLKAIGNAKRLEVLFLLSKKEIAVGPLAKMTGLSQSALSQHLLKLKKQHLVQSRRDAQHIYYRCDDASAHQVLDLIDHLFSDVSPRKRTPTVPPATSSEG